MADYVNAVPTSVGYHAVKIFCVGNAAMIGDRFYITSCGKMFEFDCVKLDASSLADPNDPQGIILFDENDNSISVYRRLCRMYKNVPIVLCGNEPGGMDLISQLKLGDGVCLPYFEISAKNNHSLEEPFLYLAKEFTGNNELRLVKSLVPACADVQMPELPTEVPGQDPEPEEPAEQRPGAGRKALKILVKTLALCAHVVIVCFADCYGC